jgi:hypothetical protein
MRAIGPSLAGVGAVLAGACARQQPAISAASPPAPQVRFAVVGEAGPADTGAPTAWVAGGVITIRGSACQVVGGGIYAVDAPPPQGVRSRQVRYEARVGPLAPGAYGIVVGWFDPRTHLIEVRREPLHVEVGFSGKDERRTGSA